MDNRVKPSPGAGPLAEKKTAPSTEALRLETTWPAGIKPAQALLTAQSSPASLSNLTLPGTNEALPASPSRATGGPVHANPRRGEQMGPSRSPAPAAWLAPLPPWIHLRMAAGVALLEQRMAELQLLTDIAFPPAEPELAETSLLRLMSVLVPRVADCAGISLQGKPKALPHWSCKPETHRQAGFLSRWAEELPSAEPKGPGQQLIVSRAGDAIACPLFHETQHLGWLLLGFDPPLPRIGPGQSAFLRAVGGKAGDWVWHTLQQNESIHTQRKRKELAERVFHELNNPLAAMLMSTTQLMRCNAESETGVPKRAALSLHTAAQRMRRVLEDLQHLHEREENAFPVQKCLVMISRLLTDLTQQVEPLLVEKSITFEVKQEDDSVILEVDPDRISQVFVNLVYNAISATPKNGRIRVQTRQEDSRWLFHIQDTGPGIPESERRHIFETRWRGTFAASNGAGLGLPIAKSIVESHQGKIWLESANASGCHFVVALPLLDTTEKPTEPRSAIVSRG